MWITSNFLPLPFKSKVKHPLINFTNSRIFEVFFVLPFQKGEKKLSTIRLIDTVVSFDILDL